MIYPAPGTHGMPCRMKNIVTVYCPDTFAVFSVRVHSVMTIQEFKLRIAKRFETFTDNVTLIIDNKEYPPGEGDLVRLSDVNVDEKKLIKVKFLLAPAQTI